MTDARHDPLAEPRFDMTTPRDTEESTANADFSERMAEQNKLESDTSVLMPAPPMPSGMMVELTNACNHACIFCTNPHMTRKAKRIDKGFLLRLMAEARDEGVKEIGFYTTGEPFVHKDLDKFVAEASRLGYSYIYISTNGAMATPDRAKRVIDAGLNSIKFSINAGTRESYERIHGKDEFDAVIENLRFISEYRKTLDRPLILFATCVVTNVIKHEQEILRDLIGDLVDGIDFYPVQRQSGNMAGAQKVLAPAEKLVNVMKNDVCLLPFNRLHVSGEGYLTLCCTDYQNYLTVADLKEVSLREAWNSEFFQDFRRRHLTQEIEGTLCGNCWKGKCDPIKPLIPEHATTIEFEEFHDKAAEKAAALLK